MDEQATMAIIFVPYSRNRAVKRVTAAVTFTPQLARY